MYRDGKLPVNLPGVLKTMGRRVVATGVSQKVVTAKQLTGTAGGIQLPNVCSAAEKNTGGVGIANYVSVLETV